jgi:uncharacterized protein YqeY
VSLEQQIEQDLKAAMLGGDTQRVSVLRGLKSVLLNEKIAKGTRETGLSDDDALSLISKESKKRQDSADLYVQGGAQDKADAELAEKAIIDSYLPAQLSEDEIGKLVDQAIAVTGASGPADMGKVIGAVRAKAGASADGGVIARIAKEKLNV